jgi:hypothetical protein
VILAVIVAFFCGSANNDQEASEWMADGAIELDHDEEYLHNCAEV